jgi:arginine:pyruvate transaminase
MRYASLVERIGGEGSRAWEIHERARERESRGEDVIVLSIGDPDFDTPAAITDSAIASLTTGRTHYTGSAGTRALRNAVAEHHQRTTGQQVSWDNVVVVPGAQCGLFSAALCVLEPGDEVIAPEPMYVTYEATIGTAGARIVPVRLRPELGFHIDPDDIARAVSPRTRAVLINTPNNPTGAMMTREELDAIAALCRKHDLWLLSDEVYASLTFGRPHISPCALEGMAERCITLSSLSKSHAMTGWRIGWVVAPRELTQHLTHLAQCMLYGSPPFIQDAAVYALANEVEDLHAMQGAYAERRQTVIECLRGVDAIQCNEPEGGMFVLLDARALGIPAFEVAAGLLEHQGVALLPADAFGPSAAGHLRLGLCCEPSVLREACARIGRYVESLPNTVHEQPG